ncbi:hypothetical protein [Georgenia deserti]|uniref:Uncharacterized protein n=1 Tax=Georgenia deserti TaxID=2093781 RepID=A0ABW4L673_9MICO
MLVGYATVLAVLPYLTLKVAWIAGSTVGIVRPSTLDASTVRTGNMVTASLELIAVGVVLTFTHTWGLRLPAWLVLAPAWAGIGLLAPFVVTGPAIAASVASGAPAGDGSLAAWVGPLVYLSFAGQALGLVTLFALYARQRWSHVICARLADRPESASQHALVAVTSGGVTLLVAASVPRLLPNLGRYAGTSHLATERGIAERLSDGTAALAAAAAIAGLVMLLWRYPRRSRTWPALTLAWVGTGAVWGSNCYSLILVLIDRADVSSGSAVASIPALDLIQIVGATALAVVGTVVLSELHATGRSSPQSVRVDHRP